MQFISDYGWFIGIPLALLIVALYVFRPRARRRYEKDAKIPFEEDRSGPARDKE